MGVKYVLAAAFVLAACGDEAGPPGPPPLVISPETGPLRCPPEAESPCAIAVGERLPLDVTGTVEEREDGFGGSRCGLGGDSVEDIGFVWTAPVAGRYRVETAGSAYDTFLSVRNGTCGREVLCNDDAEEGVDHASLTVNLAACQTVTIVVDGATIEVGAFRLSVRGTELVCDDMVDDDGDGSVDCADGDCFGRVCPGTDTWVEAWADLEWQVFEGINAERMRGATCGGVEYPPVPPLEVNRQLREAARFHSQDMTDRSYFSHDSPEGTMPSDRVATAGFRGAGPIGENIAAGIADPAEAVAGWMASEGHCTNIMNGAYHVTGVGYATGTGGDRWTQVFGGSH